MCDPDFEDRTVCGRLQRYLIEEKLVGVNSEGGLRRLKRTWKEKGICRSRWGRGGHSNILELDDFIEQAASIANERPINRDDIENLLIQHKESNIIASGGVPVNVKVDRATVNTYATIVRLSEDITTGVQGNI